MPRFRKRKGPIKGSYKKRNSVKCENCSLLVETWYYGVLHKDTEDEVGYYYNVSHDRSVEKGGGAGLGASPDNIGVNVLYNVVTTTGCPHVMMFTMNSCDYCYACFASNDPMAYRGVWLSLQHTANVQDGTGDEPGSAD